MQMSVFLALVQTFLAAASLQGLALDMEIRHIAMDPKRQKKARAGTLLPGRPCGVPAPRLSRFSRRGPIVALYR